MSDALNNSERNAFPERRTSANSAIRRRNIENSGDEAVAEKQVLVLSAFSLPDIKSTKPVFKEGAAKARQARSTSCIIWRKGSQGFVVSPPLLLSSPATKPAVRLVGHWPAKRLIHKRESCELCAHLCQPPRRSSTSHNESTNLANIRERRFGKREAATGPLKKTAIDVLEMTSGGCLFRSAAVVRGRGS
jgi:hypothetical protein